MLMFEPGDRTWTLTYREYFERNRTIFDGVSVRTIDTAPGGRYPDDVALNVLSLRGGRLLAGHKSSENTIREALCGEAFEFAALRQGYARCSCLKASDGAIITSDQSIKSELTRRGVEVLSIAPGHILLPGYNTGFIGGASCVIGGDAVFFGALESHPDAGRIRAFLGRHGLRTLSVGNGVLRDLGGICVCR